MGDTSVESNTASTNMASSMIIEKDSESCNDMERISENSQTHVLQKKNHIEKLLLPFWERGMTDTSSEIGKGLVSEALQVHPTLTRKQVKDWISNYKKKMSGKKRVRVKQSNASIRKRKRTARDMFQEEYLKKNHGSMTGLEDEWSKLDEAALSTFKEKAAIRNAEKVVLTNTEKEGKAMKIRKEMQKLATELSSIGFECFGIIAKPHTNLCAQFGTAKGKEFLNNGETYWEFLSQINVNKKDHATTEWETLRHAVQNKMNQAYKDSGMKSNRVEWRKIREGKVVVHGFPEDLNPAPASSFGREGLQKLLDDKVILSFQVAAENTTEREELPSGHSGTESIADTAENALRPVDILSDPIDLSDPEQLQNMLSLDKSTSNEPPASEGEVYPVECLLGRCTRKKVMHYLVKWKGFENPTWEPHFNIPMEIKKRFNAEK